MVPRLARIAMTRCFWSKRVLVTFPTVRPPDLAVLSAKITLLGSVPTVVVRALWVPPIVVLVL